MITLHPRAVDMASLLCRYLWLEERAKTGEGLHAWLHRRAREALETGDPHHVGGRIEWGGMTFRFAYESAGIVLVGVRPSKANKKVDAGQSNVPESRNADTSRTS